MRWMGECSSNACSTACFTAPKTLFEFLKRTSCLVGWALMSTRWPGISMSITLMGCRCGGKVLS